MWAFVTAHQPCKKLKHAPAPRALIHSVNSSTDRIVRIWVGPSGKERLQHAIVVLVNRIPHQLDAFLRTNKSSIKNCCSESTTKSVGLRTHTLTHTLTLTHRHTYTPSPPLYTHACFHKYTHTIPGHTVFWKLTSTPPSMSALTLAFLCLSRAYMSGVTPLCPRVRYDANISVGENNVCACKCECVFLYQS